MALVPLIKVFKFPVLRRLWSVLVIIALYAVLICLLKPRLPLALGIDGTEEAILTGLIFGLLMNVRTNTAYDRWWEARRLWGSLVNTSRNLYLKAAVLLVLDADERRRLKLCLNGFAVALVHHLREGGPLSAVPGFADDPARPAHVPQYLAARIYALIGRWRAEGRLAGLELVFDLQVAELMNICGACERILQTPLCASYRGLLRQGIALYVALLPWWLVGRMGWWTVPVVLLFSYPVVGLELIAHDIENPFGRYGDDLELDGIAAGIARSLDDLDTQLPPRAAA